MLPCGGNRRGEANERLWRIGQSGASILPNKIPEACACGLHPGLTAGHHVCLRSRSSERDSESMPNPAPVAA
jgi:hypothetical protein